MQKTAQIVVANGTRWAIGGQWTAGSNTLKKPSNIKSLAVNDGFDANVTSAVWLKDEAQIGFYSFEKKEKKARSLAWAALQQLGSKDFPWRGLFNLGDGVWWLLAVDHSGTVHPRWDIAGDEATIRDIIQLNIADLAPFNPAIELRTPEASWEWLLRDLTKKGPSVIPVKSLENIAKQVLIAGVLIGGIGFGGLAIMQHHLSAEHAATLARMQAEKLAQMMHMRKMLALKAAESAATKRKVMAYYANYPRPWLTSPTNSSIIRQCLAAREQNLFKYGWAVAKITCDISGDTLQVSKLWLKNELATIQVRPKGALNAVAGSVLSTKEYVLATAKNMPALPDSNKIYLRWLAYSQVYGQRATYKVNPLTPFTIPKPVFEAKNKQFHSRALWQAGNESISSILSPSHKQWLALNTLDFNIKRIIINFTVAQPLYTIDGVQYGKI
jgi:hypothetical protein